MRHYLFVVLVIIAGLSCACADPAANKPKAGVAPTAPESASEKVAGAEVLAISPNNSMVEFVGAKVTRSHNGAFKQFAGNISLVPNNVPESRVTIDIDTSSIAADDEQLTGHLKTADFFDVAKYPKASFVSTRIDPANTANANYTVTGNLDLHGVKKSITFPAKIEVAPDAVLVQAEFSINRKDFGIMYAGKADDLIRDGVVIKLSLKVPRSKP